MKRLLPSNKLVYLILLIMVSNPWQSPAFGQNKPGKIEQATRISILKNSINFFERHAYEPKLGAYYSELDSKGKRLSDKVHLVALSRMVYALSYASSIEPAYETKAQEAANFILKHMLLEDSLGAYFASTYLPGKDEAVANRSLGIWEQAYGLCGLSEWYRVSGDKDLLAQIHYLFDLFIQRFYDAEQGGCYDYYIIDGPNDNRPKSFQSAIYPVSAFMANLWEADVENRPKYEAYLARHLDLAYKKLWNPRTLWVNITFDQDWNVCGISEEGCCCFDVMPGHNFQLAWTLLRARDWNFIAQEKRHKYDSLGQFIIQTTLKHPVWGDPTNLAQGFYEQVNPETNTLISRKKSWWQHCEAIIALSFVKAKYSDELEQLERYFTHFFVDFELGNEFFYLDATNQVYKEEPKGSLGKSSYHTAEMVKYLLKNK